MREHRTRGLAAVIVGAGLIGLGILFLLGELFQINVWRVIWPFFIIVPGLLFFLGMLLGGPKAGGLAVPGSIITMTGLLLLFQSVTGLWATWAYAWTLIFPVAVGIGIALTGLWSRERQTMRVGTVMAVVGVVLFLVFAAFFELLLNISGLSIGKVLFPALLIAAGLAFAVFALAPRRRSAPAETGVEVLPPEPPQG